jgi:hypothetical protein
MLFDFVMFRRRDAREVEARKQACSDEAKGHALSVAPSLIGGVEGRPYRRGISPCVSRRGSMALPQPPQGTGI